MGTKRPYRYGALLVARCFCMAEFQGKMRVSGKTPMGSANALVGTAPLGDPKLVGNAPPPGEQLYTRYASPGAALPHSSTNLAPIGRDLVTVANNNSEKSIYVQSATLNGAPLNRPWFTHSEIANRATLVFEMGPAPNKRWGAGGAAPPSMTP